MPYELDLIHNSFYTNLLRLLLNDLLPGQFNPPPPPITVDTKGEKLWAIKAILDSRRTKQKGFQYYILWRGFGPEQITWELLYNAVNAYIAIKELKKCDEKKPRPTKQEVQSGRL